VDAAASRTLRRAALHCSQQPSLHPQTASTLLLESTCKETATVEKEGGGSERGAYLATWYPTAPVPPNINAFETTMNSMLEGGVPADPPDLCILKPVLKRGSSQQLCWAGEKLFTMPFMAPIMLLAALIPIGGMLAMQADHDTRCSSPPIRDFRVGGRAALPFWLGSAGHRLPSLVLGTASRGFLL